MTIFDKLETCGYKLTTDNYIIEEYEQSLLDVEDEGSGELKIYFNSEYVCKRVMSLLNEFGKYYKQKAPSVLNIILDESDILPSTYCEAKCKCINCSVEFKEKNECICNLDCKCINCEIEKINL
jgi:hypothetical protein